MILFLALAAVFSPSLSAAIQGRWANPDGSVTILIAPCGPAYCGTVTAASGKAKADSARGGTPHLVGTKLLSDLVRDSAGQWNGELFVPDIPMTTSAQLQRSGANQIIVTGCAVQGILCKSQVWTRAGRNPPK